MSQPEGGAGLMTVGSVPGQLQIKSLLVPSLWYLQHFCSIFLPKKKEGIVMYLCCIFSNIKHLIYERIQDYDTAKIPIRKLLPRSYSLHTVQKDF